VHVQVEPEQSACQLLPVLSWQDAVHAVGPFDPGDTLTLAEHSPPPT
jgi:hypothetical protein